jgi:hypothetical protein
MPSRCQTRPRQSRSRARAPFCCAGVCW